MAERDRELRQLGFRIIRTVKRVRERLDLPQRILARRFDIETAREDALRQIKAFPNPFYGPNYSEAELPEFAVTFSHLPRRAVIRIFNLAGNLVRVLEKDSDSQFFKWDLRNASGRFVASGLYIAHIDMPDLGVSKVLKLAVVL